MRSWVLLLGLAAVFAALVMAGGQSVLAHDALRTHAALAKEIFTIPLAASMRM
ncbi:MAG TPA: hypothetical protein VN715_12555 [Roseiarcus sp.]|nr:hypothetical protein [Roseiarcus sp.]